jgi:hypothetical protein
MRIVVCGGRANSARGIVDQELTKLHRRENVTLVSHGCSGAYASAIESWARSQGIAIVRYPPNWELFGQQAESLRNTFMLQDSRPDLVVAFPGGHATSDLVRRAIIADIAVLKVPKKCRSEAAGASSLSTEARFAKGRAHLAQDHPAPLTLASINAARH